MAKTTGMLRMDDNEMVYKSPRGIGLVLAVIGIGVIIACALGGVHKQHNGWVPFVFGGLFGMAGLISWCFVSELSIDLLKRTYHRKKGFFLSPTISDGTFEDFRGLRFTKERRTSSSKSGSSSYTVFWSICSGRMRTSCTWASGGTSWRRTTCWRSSPRSCNCP